MSAHIRANLQHCFADASNTSHALILDTSVAFQLKEHRHAAHAAEFYITRYVRKVIDCDADFEQDPQMPPMGAVLAVRVTSEDANDGFKPTCGVIDELNFRNSPDVWGYFSVKSGGGIHEFSDSQVPLAAYLAVIMCRVSAPSHSLYFLSQSLCSIPAPSLCPLC